MCLVMASPILVCISALQTIIKGNFFTEREENYVPLEELSKSTLFNSVHKGKQANTMYFLSLFWSAYVK